MEKVLIIQSKYDSKESFKCDCLKPMDEILQESRDPKLKEFYSNYFYLYAIKGQRSIFGTEKSTVFVIRKPGATIGMIELDSELKVVNAKYYVNDESLQRIMAKSLLEKLDKKIKEIFLNKKVTIVINGIHIETEENLTKEWEKCKK